MKRRKGKRKMDKLKFETPDMVSENVDKIAVLFPSAITEMRGEDGEIKRGVNFEVLKQLLSRDVVDGDECYEFTWVGKKAAMAEAACSKRTGSSTCCARSEITLIPSDVKMVARVWSSTILRSSLWCALLSYSTARFQLGQNRSQ